MPRAIASIILALPLALAAAACNPYDPDLGKTPFKCGSESPRCPDGYECNPSGVCVLDLNDVDASTQFNCANDGTEPNDTPNRAFVTQIPSGGMSYPLRNLSLCPAGDLDHFQFGVLANGTNLEARLVSVADRTPLQLTLLTPAGIMIATGISDDQDPQVVSLEVPNRLAAGSYVIQVKSPDATQENNYDLVIKTCTTPLPCP
jgi:hypothetical protein